MIRKLISVDDAFVHLRNKCVVKYPSTYAVGLLTAADEIAKIQTIDAVELPCKIGDEVWFAKRYKCHKHPRKGVVSEMYFLSDMTLHIVVKSIGRGEWGKRVFGTCEEAQAAIDRGIK